MQTIWDFTLDEEIGETEKDNVSMFLSLSFALEE